jgi:hypothetical protein
MSEPKPDINYIILQHNDKKYLENNKRGYYSDTDVVRLLTNCGCKHLITVDSINELKFTLYKANELLNRATDIDDSELIMLFEEYVGRQLTDKEKKSVFESKAVLREFDKLVLKMCSEVRKSCNLAGGGISGIITPPNASSGRKMIDYIQFFLDIGGLIPGFGIPFDFVNAIISFLRGDFLYGLISLIAMIPIVGDVMIGLKYVIKYMRMKKSHKKRGRRRR